jgi:hypothetical protein
LKALAPKAEDFTNKRAYRNRPLSEADKATSWFWMTFMTPTFTLALRHENPLFKNFKWHGFFGVRPPGRLA